MIRAAFRIPTAVRGWTGNVPAVVVAVSLLTGGCSSTPDWANPVEWYKGTRDWVTGTDPEEAVKREEASKPVPGADKDYPKLSSVPQRPAPPSEAEREAMAESLAADRDAARYTDEQIERQSQSVTRPDTPQPQTPSSSAAPSSPATASVASSRPSPPAPPPPPPQSPSEAVQNSSPSVRSASLPEVPASPPPPARIASTDNGASATTAAPPPAPMMAPPSSPPTMIPQAAPRAVPVVPSRPMVQNSAEPRFVPAHRFSSRFPAGVGSVWTPPAMVPSEPVATVYFRSGSSALGADDRREIRRAAQLAKSSGARVLVIGHASSRTENLDPLRHQMVNFRVSYDRAQAVAREMVRQGVDQEAIEISAVSDSRPVFYEVMPAGEAGNRRVEIVLTN